MSKWVVDIHGDIEGDYKIIKKYEEPKTGHWISDKNGQYCDKCGNGIKTPYNFCPFCGADMRESEDKE